jgi:hypothetical protein
MARDLYYPAADEEENDRKSYYGLHDDHPREDAGGKDPITPVRNDNDIPPQDCRCCDSCWACVSFVASPLDGHSFRWSKTVSIGAILSALFWAVLWSFATSFPTETQIQLLPGETWEISKPLLWSRRSFGLNASSTDPGIQVYEFSPTMLGEHAKCPLPTSQAVQTYKTTKIVTMVDEEAYQYDYFHLNVGSQLTVDLRQQMGSVNIYLLQGYGQLKKLQKLQQRQANTMDSGSGDTSHDFRATSILKRFSGRGGQTTFTYQVHDKADFFVLVYENLTPSLLSSTTLLSANDGEEDKDKGDIASLTQFTVNLSIDMTTYLLPAGRMVCDVLATYAGKCIWVLRTNDDRRRVAESCVIVKAVSSTTISPTVPLDGGEDSTIITVIDEDSQPFVQVTLVSQVGSPALLWIACLPLWGALIFCIRECLSCRSRHGGPSEQPSWRLETAGSQKYQPVPTNKMDSLDGHNQSSDVNTIRSYQHAGENLH